MGLLNSMTVKYGMDLTDLRAGYAEIKSLATDFAQVIGQATTVLQTMSTAFNASDLSAQIASASEQVAGLTESASVSGESLLQVGTEAETMGSEVAGAAEEASTGLAGMNSASETASGGMSGLFGKIGGLGGGLLDFGSKIGQSVFGLQAMGQAAVGMASSLFVPAMAIEESTTSFQVFDGSMQKAQQEMADLSAFAAHTPFETQAIDDAALKMQSVGINAQAVIPDIHALGDALDATGRVSSADLDMIVSDFDKIQTTGHLTTDVMNSFALQGIDAWSVLEKQTGKTRAELGTMISKGLFPAKDAMADLTQGIEKNPLYSGQMANDTNSMTGIMSTLKSNWDQALASFASPVMKDLEPILNGISTDLSSQGFKDFAGSVGAKIAGVFGNIADAAKKVDFKSIGDQVAKLGNWFKTSLQPALEKAEPDFAQLATTVGNLASSALPPLLTAVGNLIPDVVTLAGDIAGGLNTAVTVISTNFSTWGPIVTSVAIALSVLFIPAIIKSGVESVVAGTKIAINYVKSVIASGVAGWDAFSKIAVWIGQMILAGAQAVISGAQIAANFVATLVKSGVESVVAGAKIVGNFIASIVTSGASAVVSGAQIVGSFIAGMITSGAQAVISGAQIVANFVGSLIEAAAQATLTGAAFVADLIPAILSFTADALVAAATAIPAILAGFGAWIISAGIVAVENIIAFWPIYLVILAIAAVIAIVIIVIQNWGAIIGWLGEQWQRFIAFVQLNLKLFGALFSELGTMFHNAFQTAWNNVTGIFASAGAWFHDHVWQPVADRFTDVFNGLKDKATGIFSQVTGGVKAAFNTVIDFINNGIKGINNVTGKVGIPSIPLLPHLSTGGVVEPGKWAVAGDPGPNSELIYGGTAGATVFSHGQSQAMLGSGGGSVGGGSGRGDTHVHIHLDSQEIAQYSAEAAADIIVKKVFGHGPVREAA